MKKKGTGRREQGTGEAKAGAKVKAEGLNETRDWKLVQRICEECQRETEADMVSQPKGSEPVRF